MTKFKIKMKLQGLELEIEGTRDDVPLITQNISQQLSGLLQPAGAIVEGDVIEQRPNITNSHGPTSENSGRPRRARKRQVVAPNINNAVDSSAIDWQHDSEKYGMPQQSWTVAQKALWTLYVIKEAASVPDLSASRISKTFNKQFRQAGAISPSNVSRDLGKQKMTTPSKVGEDTTKTPTSWYLTDTGRRAAQDLIAGLTSDHD